MRSCDWDVAVFGAGVAGLTAAIALSAGGRRCRIFERSRQSHEAGMGFILMPEIASTLNRFGVSLGGIPLDRYRCHDFRGKLLHEEGLPRGARGLRRRDLMTALRKALPAAATLLFNRELAALEFDAEGCVTAARFGSGQAPAAGLYVAADGASSIARKALFPTWTISPCQVQEIVGLVNSEAAARWAGENFNKFHSREGGLALGVLPVGGGGVIWFLQFDAARFAPVGDNPAAQQEFALRVVRNWGPPIPQLLEATDFNAVHRWRPFDAALIPRFHQGNLALVGDAAHPLSPFTSQGVSAAIADAIALAEEVNGVSSCQDLERTLESYTKRRREQCAPYVEQGNDLVRRFLQPLSEHSLALPIAQS